MGDAIVKIETTAGAYVLQAGSNYGPKEVRETVKYGNGLWCESGPTFAGLRKVYFDPDAIVALIGRTGPSQKEEQ